MNYIAIKDFSFLMLSENSNIQELINNGFTIMTKEQYDNYILQVNSKSEEEILIELEKKSEEYINHGHELFEIVKKKTWAVNTLNISKGIVLSTEQMKSLLSTSDMLEKSLKTGSFKTAKDVALYLKITLPQYASIADFVISDLNQFMGII